MANILRKQGHIINGSGGGDTSALANKTDLTAIILTGTTNTSGDVISAGTWFYLNGTPCIAKVDIASGATFTEGTNYEEKTVGSALSELNSNIGANVIGSLTTITTDVFTFPKDGYIYLNAEISGAKCIVNLHDANGTGIQSEIAMAGNCHFVYVKKGMKCQLSTGSQGSYSAFYVPLS